ncbi:MAG: hypothetical protein HFF36_03595 [Coprobacillus sp.]|nr:hypothetical protein [Coprobacillus sp.]
MRVISGLNYTEKLETMIQECIKNAQENPFESYFFIAENPLIVEKIFFKYTSYLVNIEVLSWYDFLKTLQIEECLTAHHVIENTELVYHLQHILKTYSFRCFETEQPYPLIDKLICLLRDMNLSLTEFQNIDLSLQPKLIDFVNLQQYLSERLDQYTHLTIESIFKNCSFDSKRKHIYIEADHLYQQLCQDIIQRLSHYHDITLLYTYHHDNRLFNMPYHSLCNNAIEFKKTNFLLDYLFLQTTQSCFDEKELYTFTSPTPHKEVERVIYTIYQKIVDENLRYQDFAIVYPDHSYVNLLIQNLDKLHIPHQLPMISSCQYDLSYQKILKKLDTFKEMSVSEFAHLLNNEDIEHEYQTYLKSLYTYDDVMTAKEFKEFFKSTYKKDHQTLYNNQDHIYIYSIKDFKLAQPKHIFILGMNETVLPQFIKDTSLLLNEDIEFLRQHRIHTPFTTQEQLGVHYNDILKVLQHPYLSMTISYSVSSLSGNTLLPSSLYKQLRCMFKFKQLPIHRYLSIEEYYLIGGEKESKNIINCHIHDYLNNKNQPIQLKQETVKRLYHSTMSVSQIETYNKCPFLYFIQYGLGICPLKEDKLMPNELGSLIHYVLSIHLFHNKDINQLVDNYILEDKNLTNKMKASPLNQYFIEQLKKDLIITLNILNQILDISLFDIYSCEEMIEDNIKDIHFKGFVDRVDICQNYMSIIDYKSSSKDIDLNLAMQGFNIQMLLYLKMMTKKYHKDPAAVLYFNTKRRILTSSQSLDEDILNEDIQDLYRYGGYIIDDENHQVIQSLDPLFDKKSHIINVSYVKSKDMYKGRILTQQQLKSLLQIIEDHIYELYQQMMNGDISISPKGSDQTTTHTLVNPCHYCAYHSVCQFDVFYNDYHLVEFYDLEERLGGTDNAI